MQNIAQHCNGKNKPNMHGRENCRLRASANRAEVLYPVDITHLCLNHNSCVVEGVTWKIEFIVTEMI